jgi:hypothetical protein
MVDALHIEDGRWVNAIEPAKRIPPHDPHALARPTRETPRLVVHQ